MTIEEAMRQADLAAKARQGIQPASVPLVSKDQWSTDPRQPMIRGGNGESDWEAVMAMLSPLGLIPEAVDKRIAEPAAEALGRAGYPGLGTAVGFGLGMGGELFDPLNYVVGGKGAGVVAKRSPEIVDAMRRAGTAAKNFMVEPKFQGAMYSGVPVPGGQGADLAARQAKRAAIQEGQEKIPQGMRKKFKEMLNDEDIDYGKSGRHGQTSRKYGDYLYSQDKAMFDDYMLSEWAAGKFDF